MNATRQAHRPSMHLIDAIDGITVPVTVSGPDRGRTIIMFEETSRIVDTYDTVRERLHVAMFRTVVISARNGLTPKAVIAVLDQLKVVGGLIVADGVCGDLAWSLAAAHGARFTGLVVIDSGHPAVPNVDGRVRDIHCPAVEVDTTVLVGGQASQAIARASRRLVQGEFRLVELAGPRTSRHFTTQLAAEIVVRALSR
ncbi:alpha/beta hydrolase [Mycolicibacterium sp. 120270]|uniref:alpha/beta hydrolase n=1 Tax=Mycolicibacterium sp. 120270 TaxID=3090600 RepID=UPI00299D3E80|nr:alpha/beta hydrolase [Mycolicibacterium sp. 120270]MDX1882155.1 alpha/beta hydrolase [Mycolicibacterium sp. 120270]